MGYRVVPFVANTWEYGVPQKRVRQLFIGTLAELPIFSPSLLFKKTHSLNHLLDGLKPIVTLGEAIEDLPPIIAGDERVEQDYDLDLRLSYRKKYPGNFLDDVLQIKASEKLTWHCARPHSERDLRDFARLREGETCGQAIARGVEMEFPYDRSSFKDRYTRQSRERLCSTIVAHLKSDGLMFIHPTQNRSLTPREAARVQTFPDSFKFVGRRSHAFMQIGNAVPPLIGKVVGLGVIDFIKSISSSRGLTKLSNSQKLALIADLEQFINDSYIRPLEFVDEETFIHIWSSIHLLLPHLHPESALDNGKDISPIRGRKISFCLEPYYLRSGWPIELLPIANEARKRFEQGNLCATDYYHIN
jgi:DNA (cytosine-5)-methyltransferase 1